MLIVALAASFAGTHTFYYGPKIANLEKDIEIAQLKEEQCKTEFKNQTDEILDQSTQTTEVVTERFDRLEKMLERLSNAEQEQIQDILDEEVPNTCGELNEFLIDMVEKLGW